MHKIFSTKKIKLVAKLLNLRHFAHKSKISLEEMTAIVKSDYANNLNKNFATYRKDLYNLVDKNPGVSLSELFKKYFDNLALK